MFPNCIDITGAVFHVLAHQTHVSLKEGRVLGLRLACLVGARPVDAAQREKRVSTSSRSPPLPCFSPCNDLDQMLLCGIRSRPPSSITPSLPPFTLPLTLALWLTGVSLVQYVCQWDSRLNCAHAYP